MGKWKKGVLPAQVHICVMLYRIEKYYYYTSSSMLNSRAVGNAIIGVCGIIGIGIASHNLRQGIEQSSANIKDGLVNAMSGKGSGSFHLEEGLKAIAVAISKVGSFTPSIMHREGRYHIVLP